MKSLRVHCIQHVPFEGMGYIKDWVLDNGHTLSHTAVYNNDPWPDTADFDMLVVMGGPMGVHDDDNYEWLVAEKKIIARAVFEQKLLLGICLGAQLMAHVMGANVYPGKNKEIGWFPLELTATGSHSPLDAYDLPVFHWHGDTFEIPENAICLAQSPGCKNQAFLKDTILGLQFHPEIKEGMVAEMIGHCGHELAEKSEFVQSEEKLLNAAVDYDASKQMLYGLLNGFIALRSEAP